MLFICNKILLAKVIDKSSSNHNISIGVKAAEKINTAKPAVNSNVSKIITKKSAAQNNRKSKTTVKNTKKNKKMVNIWLPLPQHN